MEKIPYDQFIDTLAAARLRVAPGTRWRHYRGNEYVVKDIVLLEATVEVAVVYMPINQPEIAFVRPITGWFELVDTGGQPLQRFTKLADAPQETAVA
ncbi:MAG TPA: DUF1653 domain-containing protein [Candidatus Saccharimonadia bacterium]|nr:DUF1653 domain-containing protein [Candidatus Saccharimonadia bacterium]